MHVHASAQFVIGLAGFAFALVLRAESPAETVAKLVQDRSAAAQGSDEIESDWRFRAAELGVEVEQGIVTLTGTVSSYPQLRHRARRGGTHRAQVGH